MGRRATIDETELITLANARKPDGSKYTHQEIAEYLGVQRSAVTRALQRVPQSMLNQADVASYREARADIFAELQRLILMNITPQKLKQASLNQLGTLFGIVYDKEKLEKGEATSHVAVLNRHELDPQIVHKIKDVISDITQTKLIEAKNKSLEMSKTQETSDGDTENLHPERAYEEAGDKD